MAGYGNQELPTHMYCTNMSMPIDTIFVPAKNTLKWPNVNQFSKFLDVNICQLNWLEFLINTLLFKKPLHQPKSHVLITGQNGRLSKTTVKFDNRPMVSTAGYQVWPIAETSLTVFR